MDMVKIPSCALSAIVSVIICTGCSVKENRDACPCRLILDYSGVDTSVVRTADLFIRSDDGFFFTQELGIEDFRSQMEVLVPRREIGVAVWDGTDGLLSDRGMIIPEGEDCPPVYLHSSCIDADRERVIEKVVMRKNFCVMTVNLNNVESAPESLSIVGQVNGYLIDGTPSPGIFRYVLETWHGRGGLVALPRQKDDSLVLELMDGDGILRRFNIGEYITDSGYDWNKPDLEDITLDIDVAVTEVKLSIQGWEKIYRFSVII